MQHLQNYHHTYIPCSTFFPHGSGILPIKLQTSTDFPVKLKGFLVNIVSELHIFLEILKNL